MSPALMYNFNKYLKIMNQHDIYNDQIINIDSCDFITPTIILPLLSFSYNYNKKIKDHKGVCPNWVTSIKSKKRIRPRLSIYANAKIIVWYYTHKQLPNYCNYNSHVFSSTTNANSSKKSKYGHATKSGCDNRGQNTSVNCGPHSVQEIVRNLTGVIIPQSTLASWAGTTSGGSSHAGLETAIAMAAKKTEVKLSCKWYNFSDLGWTGITKIIKSPNQDCLIHNLYRNKWGHYEVVNNINGNIINVQNSLGDTCTKGCYCGYVENRQSSEFKKYISGISQKSVLVVTRG